MSAGQHTSDCHESLGVCAGDRLSLAELQAAFVRQARAAHAEGPAGEAAFRRAAQAFQLLAASRRGGEGAGLRAVGHPSRAPPGPFLRRLHGLLSRLPPEQRRMAIAQRLSQAQRLRLERWMLAKRSRGPAVPRAGAAAAGGRAAARGPSAGPGAPRGRPVTQRSLCRLVARSGRVGFRPVMHLCGGLYAQAAFSFSVELGLRGLAALMAMRARCQAACAPGQAAAGSVEQRVRRAVQEAQLGCGASLKFYFKTRLRISSSGEASWRACRPAEQCSKSLSWFPRDALRTCLA
ncbi:unnamed protein product, partial [Prorocentrum cordatum]